MTRNLKCAVIGGGIAGASAAYALSKRGARVQLFEQFGLAHDRGSSHGPTRLFRLAYFEHPDYVPLLRMCISHWRALEAEANDTLFYQIGIFMIGAPKGSLFSGVRRAASDYGVAIEELGRNDARKRYPHFSQPEGYDAIFEPEAGFIRADRALKHFFAGITDLGGVLRPETPVTDWEATRDGIDVITKDGRETFDRLVIAPGAWGNDLLKLDVSYRADAQNPFLDGAGREKIFA